MNVYFCVVTWLLHITLDDFWSSGVESGWCETEAGRILGRRKQHVMVKEGWPESMARMCIEVRYVLWGGMQEREVVQMQCHG